MRSLILTFIFLFNLNASVVLESGKKSYDNFQIEYLFDNSDNLEFEDILEKKFHKTSSNRFTFTYRDKPTWVKFTITNQTTKTQDLIIALEEPFLDVVNLYYKKGNKTFSSLNGLSIPKNEREVYHPNPNFPVTIEANKSQTFYMKLESKFATFGEILIYDSKDIIQADLTYYSLYFLYLGTIIAVSLYNFFLYLSLKDKTYLYYIGYTLNFGLWVSAYSGVILLFIPVKYDYMLHFSTPLAFVFFILFSNKILNIKRHFPKFINFLKINLFTLLAASLIIFFNVQLGMLITNIISNYLFFTYLVLAFILMMKGDTIGKYYLLALSFFLVSFSIMVLMVMGVIDNTPFVRYAFIFGSFVEMILFSFLLAFKINLLQKEYELKLETEIEKKTTDLKNNNFHLERVLDEREDLIREVYHRVKNNFQIIISILGMEAYKSDETGKKIIQNITARIKAMANVHQTLYNSNTKGEVELLNYFDSLIDNIVVSQELVNIKIIKVIENITLSASQANTLGFIVNELITNSIKHAFSDNGGEIFVKITEDKDYITFIYKDDGDKHNEKVKANEGIKLINKFTKNLKNSTVEMKTKTGIEYIITFYLH